MVGWPHSELVGRVGHGLIERMDNEDYMDLMDFWPV